jgi:hypothetical protein
VATVSGLWRIDAIIVWKADSGNSEVGTYRGVIGLNGVAIAPVVANNISTGESNSHSMQLWNEVEMSPGDYLETMLSPDTANARAISGADTGTFCSVASFKLIRPLVP